MNERKKSTKKNIYIYTRTYEERAAWSQPRSDTPGDWHWAPAAPREPLPHTVQSARTGGTREAAQGSSRLEQRSNAFGGSHLHCPPSLPCRGPRAEPSAGGAASTHFGGVRSLHGGCEGGGSQPRLSATTPPFPVGLPRTPGLGRGSWGRCSSRAGAAGAARLGPFSSAAVV